MTRRTALRLGVLALLPIVWGCGPRALPSNDRVSGVVTLDGKKLPGAAIEFMPLTTIPGRVPDISRAVTDENGRYTLIRLDKKPGAVLCRHRVTVTPARPTTEVPRVYWISGSTPLYVEVTLAQHEYDLKLSKDAKHSGAKTDGE